MYLETVFRSTRTAANALLWLRNISQRPEKML